MDRIGNRAANLWVCFLLSAATLAVYWPLARHQFVNLDDIQYVMTNPNVQAGLSWQGLHWAFTTGHAANWHPITWLSHMLDCQLFGLKPGPEHLVSLAFHLANTLLLFALLRRLTGAFWPSALVAALFAWHPLHVESVAWIAERKDVLSTFFFMLTLLAYARYAAGKAEREWRIEDRGRKVEKKKASRVPASTLHAPSSLLHPPCSTHSRPGLWYALSLALFALGLMSKPMLVTLPFVLLLLDFWPLGRLHPSGVQGSMFNVQCSKFAFSAPKFVPVLLEKLPFLALSAASCAVTFLVQRAGGAVMQMTKEPLSYRLENALLSYALYLKKMLWPVDLAVFYPLQPTLHFGALALAAVLLVALTVLALAGLRRRPWLAVGWFWFVGMLVPVIGLVQVGGQAMADRYTYLPLIGIFIALAWEITDRAAGLAKTRPRLARSGLGGFCLALLAACLGLTSSQVAVWQDSETLFRHALSVTQDNARAHVNLGLALADAGRNADALSEFKAALQINPRDPDALVGLGCMLSLSDRYPQAIEQFRAALAIEPTYKAHYFLALALRAEGKDAQSLAELRATLRFDPERVQALNDLAWALATAPEPAERNGAEAVELAERACRLTFYREPQFIGTLAAAYAEAGRFEEAVKTAEHARQLALAAGNQQLAQRNEELLSLYHQRRAFHELGK